MIVHRAYKFRAYPSPEQARTLLRWEESLRFLWNLGNEQWHLWMSRAKAHRRYPRQFQQSVELTELRREVISLREVPRNACDDILRRLEKAWLHCFKRITGRPRWKRGDSKASLSEPHARAWHFDTAAGTLTFPKLGPMRVRVHRVPVGKRKGVSIVRDGDQWLAFVVYEQEIADPAPRLSPAIAIDRGITNILADSDGRILVNPKHFEAALARVRRAQRIMDRRQLGSANWQKARLRLASIHRKMRRQREHMLHTESRRYADRFGTVVLEALDVEAMAFSPRFGRKIHSAGWSMFRRHLDYKMAERGGRVVEVEQAYSSQTCAECGHVDKSSRRGERFACTACGCIAHADTNAAKVLLIRAGNSPVTACGGAGFKPPDEPGMPCREARE